jgi:hypothetical protein
MACCFKVFLEFCCKADGMFEWWFFIDICPTFLFVSPANYCNGNGFTMRVCFFFLYFEMYRKMN